MHADFQAYISLQVLGLIRYLFVSGKFRYWFSRCFSILERSVGHLTYIRPKGSEGSSTNKEFPDTFLQDVSRAIQTKD